MPNFIRSAFSSGPLGLIPIKDDVRKPRHPSRTFTRDPVMLDCSALPASAPTAEAAREMPQMMLSLGIEPALVREDHPALYSSMGSVCAACPEKERCDHDLGTGTVTATYADYCGNAATLGLLANRTELKHE